MSLQTKIDELKAAIGQSNQDRINRILVELFQTLSAGAAAPAEVSFDKAETPKDFVPRAEFDAVVAELASLRKKFAAFDRDGDGKPGGSKPRAKKVADTDNITPESND